MWCLRGNIQPTAPRLIFNCQCHSCVAAIAAIEAKESFAGTSMKCDDSENSGAAVAVYKSNNVTVTKVDETKIDFVKVGEEGKIARPYCKDCGTVLFNVWAPNWCAANRNAMTTSDGKPLPSNSIMNVNCSKSFDKTKCPKPSHGSVPFGTLFKFNGERGFTRNKIFIITSRKRIPQVE